MLAEVLPPGSWLVVVDHDLALPLAANPVGVSALQAVGDAVGGSMAVFADQRRTVALLAENGEETLNRRPTSHYVVRDPGNLWFGISFVSFGMFVGTGF
jgi:hypothetical protein